MEVCSLITVLLIVNELCTCRPRILCVGTVRSCCRPIPRRARFDQHVFDPQHGRQRLHRVLSLPFLLTHPALHSLLSVCARLGLEPAIHISGVFRWVKQMRPGPFTPDEEWARHGRGLVGVRALLNKTKLSLSYFWMTRTTHSDVTHLLVHVQLKCQSLRFLQQIQPDTCKTFVGFH